MSPMYVLVCGTNYGRTYLEAIRGSREKYCLAGILARGSARSHQLAREYGVPLFCSVDDLVPGIDLACVAVGASGSDLALRLLARDIHVLCEHPQKSSWLESALGAAASRGLCFHVNGHFAELEAAGAFINQCRRESAAEPPAFLHVTATDRSLYAALDILQRILVSLAPIELHACSRLLPFTIVQGIMRGVPSTFLIQHNADGHPYPDASLRYLVDHRITVGFPSGILTLLSMNGPVVWNANLNFATRPAQPLFAVTHEDRALTLDLLHQQRIAANLANIAALAKDISTRVRPLEQTPDYLIGVSRTWEALGSLL